jgi:hypothetical protein
MKEFYQKYPRISKIIGAILLLAIFWGMADYEFYSIKRNAYIAGCMAGSHGSMGSFQCWSVYHATGYN